MWRRGRGLYRSLFYGEYSNRTKGTGESHEPAIETPQEEKPRKRRLSTWPRLLAKAYQVDPLVCTRCGKRMSVAGFVTAAAAIGWILDNLGLSTPEAEMPPLVPEILRIARRGGRLSRATEVYDGIRVAGADERA